MEIVISDIQMIVVFAKKYSFLSNKEVVILLKKSLMHLIFLVLRQYDIRYKIYIIKIFKVKIHDKILPYILYVLRVYDLFPMLMQKKKDERM